MNQNAKIVKTADGSDTLFLSELNETYHSIHGAKQESIHVYIKSGLEYYLEQFPETKNLHVLEIGMGTGLNCALAYEFAEKHKINIHLTTLEPFPLDWKLLKNYNFSFENEKTIHFLKVLHSEMEWNKPLQFGEYFSIEKQQILLQNFKSDAEFQAVFFDAFAPNKQEEMWSLENFQKLFSLTKQGVLVTYCAQGKVRRTMQEATFTVQRIEGPPGKREMLRAITF